MTDPDVARAADRLRKAIASLCEHIDCPAPGREACERCRHRGRCDRRPSTCNSLSGGRERE